MSWNQLVWQIILAVAPVICVYVVTKALELYDKQTDKVKQEINAAVVIGVTSAQKLLPTPAERKQAAIDYVVKHFPALANDKDELSHLIEACVAAFELGYTSWKGIQLKPATPTADDDLFSIAATPVPTVPPSGATTTTIDGK